MLAPMAISPISRIARVSGDKSVCKAVLASKIAPSSFSLFACFLVKGDIFRDISLKIKYATHSANAMQNHKRNKESKPRVDVWTVVSKGAAIWLAIPRQSTEIPINEVALAKTASATFPIYPNLATFESDLSIRQNPSPDIRRSSLFLRRDALSIYHYLASLFARNVRTWARRQRLSEVNTGEDLEA